MKVFRFFILLSIAFVPAWLPGQLTIHITSVPVSTPQHAPIYIAGNFNSWNPGDPNFQLTEEANGEYQITFTPSINDLEFKFTRGSWATVEGNAEGNYLPNRTYYYNGQASTLNLTIASWEDLSESPHTATDNVQILDEDYFMPQLDRHRRIWIYLPPDYATSGKHYPVIYMQDGQNLFDAYYSFAGEWKIDESMNDLFTSGDYGAIVVGIDNGGADRINEYSPWFNPTYGGGQGEAYVSFLVNTLKPHIDSTFRTLTGRDYTAIAGSSMGGIISMYAAAAHPDVFSKAGIFSPAFWFSDSTYLQVMEQTFDEDIRVYFVAGVGESQSMMPDIQHMNDVLLQEDIDPSNLKIVAEADGAHSEWFWAREYPDAYVWLFENVVLAEKTPHQKKIKVFPNPVRNRLYIDSSTPNYTYSIYSLTGNLIMSGHVNLAGIEVDSLSPGMYILESGDDSAISLRTLFVKQ